MKNPTGMSAKFKGQWMGDWIWSSEVSRSAGIGGWVKVSLWFRAGMAEEEVESETCDGASDNTDHI